jgi:predicted metalloprotease
MLCAALLLAACGSSGGSGSASSDGPRAATATATSGATATAAATISSAGLERLPAAPSPTGAPPSSESSPQSAFLRGVFDDVEALWRHEFRSAGATYRLRLGDFAQAYVVAHEVAHHVQTLLGISHQKALADHEHPAGANDRSVRFELQADCLAGVWMHSAYQRGHVSDADLEDALNAAAVVGDDFLRNAAGETRPPETWTHGSSAQRQHWLKTGFAEGQPTACDTFSE